MDVSRIGPFSASVIEESEDHFEYSHLDQRISSLCLGNLSSSSIICAASSPGAASSVGSVSSPMPSPPVSRKLERTIETELEAYPVALQWVQSLLKTEGFRKSDVEDIMLYDAHSQHYRADLRAALLLREAVRSLAKNKIQAYEDEPYSYALQFMICFLPNDVPEVLLHDHMISDGDFSVYMKLFEQFGVVSFNREKKTISVNPEFHALLCAYYLPRASDDDFIASDEYFAERVSQASINDYPLLMPHLNHYLASDGHDTFSVYYQFLTQFVQRPQRLVQLWLERARFKSSKNYLEAARISMSLGQYARAKQELTRALKQCDKKIQSEAIIAKKHQIFLQYAKVCCEMNECEESLQRVNGLDAVFPASCILLRAESYLGLEKVDQALIELEKLKDVEKTAEELAQFLIIRAKIHIHFGEIIQARTTLLEAENVYRASSVSFEKEVELLLLQLFCQKNHPAFRACMALIDTIQQELGCAHPLYAYALFTQANLMKSLGIPDSHIPYSGAKVLMDKLLQEI